MSDRSKRTNLQFYGWQDLWIHPNFPNCYWPAVSYDRIWGPKVTKMGTIYRSEKMALCQMFLQTESAYSCIGELGELGLVQFRDLNPDVTPFQRKFVNEVRRCDEMERKLRFIEHEMSLDDTIKVTECLDNPPAPEPREMNDLEAKFEQLEQQIIEVNQNEAALKQNFLELTELKYVLQKTSHFFDEQENMHAMASLNTDSGIENPSFDLNGDPGAPMPVLPEKEEKSDLNFVAGTIARARIASFERLLWRACRGNIFMRQEDIPEKIEDPKTRDTLDKSVFIIFFQGEQLKTRVKKICDAFRAQVYPCPNTAQERREMAVGLMTRLQDLVTVLNQSSDHRRRVLNDAAQHISRWFVLVTKIKSIYHTQNLLNLDVTQKALIAECWCPERDLSAIMMCLNKGTTKSGSTVPAILNRMDTDEDPPTYFRNNKFTKGFQNIVDSYGIAKYREVNPAPWTCITFPFLFGVMFGDMGHGMIMLLFALFLVLFEKKLERHVKPGEIFATFYGGRYVILLMGMFSIYTGIIYNEVYAKSVGIFGISGWRNPYTREFLDKYSNEWEGKSADKQPKFQVDPQYGFASGIVYPVGFDPIWNIAGNKLNYMNSFKMKMSVILGISQMTFGVILSFMNDKYFKNFVNIFCQFIPSMLFLGLIFIYLCVLIIYKWIMFTVTPGFVSGQYYPGTNCAPSLLVGLINMFMAIGSKAPSFVKNYTDNGPGGKPHWDDVVNCGQAAFYPNQGTIEIILVIIAVIAVPWMLLIKPFILRSQAKKQNEQHITVHADLNNDSAEIITEQAPPKKAGGGGDPHGGDGEFSFGDAMVYQAIHTIEFALGCISHTASYLRLWALSLAHTQLSEVLWTFVMRQAFTMGGSMGDYVGGVLVYFVFWGFSVLTVAILVLMEGLSAFLHALRLHWVEFQSKFYGMSGTGYVFEPFSFDAILKAEPPA